MDNYDYDYDLLAERVLFTRLIELDNRAFRVIESGDYKALDEINQEIDEIILSLCKRRQLINE